VKCDIVVSKVNESTVFVDCNSSICQELSTYFSAFVDNHKFIPSVRQGRWDGKIRAFDSNTNHLPIGLLNTLKEFCIKGKYTLKIEFTIKEQIDLNTFKQFIDGLKITDDKGNPMTPRDFQLQAAYEAICNKHLNIDSSTGSGKSLIIYIITKWLLTQNKKIFIVVPSVALVEQLVQDFYEYGWKECDDKICRVYAGQKRLMKRPIIISTWQSLFDNDEELSKIEALIIDEAHGQSGTSKAFANVAKKSINAEYRIGLSGSMPKNGTADWLTTVGATGPITIFSTYKKLQDANQLSKLKIKMIILEYPNVMRQENYKENQSNYSNESDYINGLLERNIFIKKLTQQLKGNTLIFFQKKTKHGYILHKELKTLIDKKVIYVDGDNKDLNHIRQYIENNDNCVLLGSNVLVTGINIKRIHNIIFAQIGKSDKKIKQALGRGLRLYSDKEYLNVFDIVDDVKIKVKYIDTNQNERWKTYINYSLRHAKERNNIYKSLGFDVEQLKYQIKQYKKISTH